MQSKWGKSLFKKFQVYFGFVFFIVIFLNLYGMTDDCGISSLCGTSKSYGYWNQMDLENLAVINVPIADAVVGMLATSNSSSQANWVKKQYKKMPISFGDKKDSCKRAHQLLFNEVVKIKQVSGQECECELLNAFYEVNNLSLLKVNKTKKCVFWTLKENLTFLSELREKDNLLKYVPCPFCDGLENVLPLDGYAVLIKPWYDANTERLFSVGTKFVRNPDLDREHTYAIYVICKDNVQVCYVPKTVAISKYSDSIDEAIKQFVEILKIWSKLESIAYAWGGCSCSYLYPKDNFEYIKLEDGTDFWQRAKIEDQPFSGFDCSGLILRVAQACGLPYFFKNTTTLAKHLRELNKNDKIENGDLIYFPGHVAVISDLENNEIIEARGYSSGYGKIHCLKLAQLFDGINTFEELVEGYFNSKPVKLLDKNKVPKIISELKLLKLSSVKKNIL